MEKLRKDIEKCDEKIAALEDEIRKAKIDREDAEFRFLTELLKDYLSTDVFNKRKNLVGVLRIERNQGKCEVNFYTYLKDSHELSIRRSDYIYTWNENKIMEGLKNYEILK